MKTMPSTVFLFTPTLPPANVFAKAFGTMVIAFALVIGPAVRGVTVSSKAANAEVLLGLPAAGLEFENPLTGTERVLGHVVLEWRDADFNKPGHPLYDDWDVFTAGGAINGTVNEIWMRMAGQYIWTTNTVPSTMVSIHMTGDNNDGLAEVFVDGNQVAKLDMFTAAGSQTALIVVRGLPNTTHTIQVSAVGIGQGFDDDVHVFGAAALKENPIKWNQPPVTAHPTNLYNGWNQTSVTNNPWATWVGIAADDWVCMSTNPVTKIRWWGSFMNWRSNTPPLMPTAFQITIWTDVPTNASNPFSHPGTAIWQTHCKNYKCLFAGWDYDPRTNSVEACFLFEQNLATNEYFKQPGGPGTIYWISIAAEYAQGTAGPNPWGWKTRPRDPLSPAPDDAVQILQPPPWQIVPGMPFMLGVPIFWPDPAHSWDLAFELISSGDWEGFKWEQLPDLSPAGIDINATANPPPPNPYLLADDFLCTTPGLLTNITIWGSWRYDELPVNPSNVIFTLSIHSDIINPNPFSMPGQTLQWWTFGPGQYTCTTYATNLHEGWMDPPANYSPNSDWTCYQYDFNIPAGLAFLQAGTPGNPIVYWLDVQANVMLSGQGFMFGWKTSITNWNDAAVWTMGGEPYNGPWNPLIYPPQHPYANSNIDLAFRLNGSAREIYEVKWSQPPVLATNGFNGWNQYSVYDTTMWVADDWACTTTNPVTDIHWWGSFIGWSEPTNPPAVPDAFNISFWTDVPAQPGGFSHPGVLLQQILCTNFTWHFVGWDFDPRNPNLPPDACFLFEQDFQTNEWFYQKPASGTNIYWVSIAAFYYLGPNVEYPWGWKSRPRDTNSLAPDDAVIFDPYGGPSPIYQPIWWPDPTNSWDMAFQLTTHGPEDLDFGDAPDPNYPTLLTSNGARHYILPNFCLGTLIDAETNGLPNGNATGDDINNLADEDGVTFLTPLLLGTQACAQVVLTSPYGNGQLDTWVDFNRNGAWETGETVFNNQTLLSGTNTLYFQVPTNAVLGPTFARFRLSSTGGLLSVGAAADGEVEDYYVTNVQRRPLTNIVITNIVVTVTNVTIGWNAETNVHYQLRAATTLSNAPSVTWSDIGPEVIGPANSQTETNSQPFERYYRVVAPYVWP